jgi:hypothetical protein
MQHAGKFLTGKHHAVRIAHTHGFAFAVAFAVRVRRGSH